MSPTEVLEREHRFIQKVVAAAAAFSDRLAAGLDLEAGVLQGMVEFMRTYADKCHHGKEEGVLFPALVKRGVPTRGCPIEGLTKEHQMGRMVVSGLAEAVDAFGKGSAGARDALIRSLRGIVELYPNHIWKEDFLLLPMTNKVLSQEDQDRVCLEFERVEESLGRDVHHRFERFAEDLSRHM